MTHLERAQIASLALLADDMIEADLEAELVGDCRVSTTWFLRRDEMRRLILASDMPLADCRHLRYARADCRASLIRDALMSRLLKSRTRSDPRHRQPDPGGWAVDRGDHADSEPLRERRCWIMGCAF